MLVYLGRVFKTPSQNPVKPFIKRQSGTIVITRGTTKDRGVAIYWAVLCNRSTACLFTCASEDDDDDDDDDD